MKIARIAVELLHQLKEISADLGNEAYQRPLEILGGSSIGAHNRHSIEFFQMLISGCTTGYVSYDDRKHDKELESDIRHFSHTVSEICDFLIEVNVNMPLTLKVHYPQSGIKTQVETNLKREIIYNIEHLVHHMAILKIGIKENFPEITLDKGFGIAQSTIAYQESEV